MGLFSFFRKKQDDDFEEDIQQPEPVAPPAAKPAAEQPVQILQPYKNESLNKVYNLLFCDDIELFRYNNATDHDYPWDILLQQEADTVALQQVMADTRLESRIKILAANRLMRAGIHPEKELLGVIAEVSLPGGLDVLASFKDGTARYINHAEGMIVWEVPDAMSTDITHNIFTHAAAVVEKIGPWDKKRLPFPPAGTVRLSFLVTDGLYFGQAPANMFFNDAMAGPVLNAASRFMVYLMDQAKAEQG